MNHAFDHQSQKIPAKHNPIEALNSKHSVLESKNPHPSPPTFVRRLAPCHAAAWDLLRRCVRHTTARNSRNYRFIPSLRLNRKFGKAVAVLYGADGFENPRSAKHAKKGTDRHSAGRQLHETAGETRSQGLEDTHAALRPAMPPPNPVALKPPPSPTLSTHALPTWPHAPYAASFPQCPLPCPHAPHAASPPPCTPVCTLSWPHTHPGPACPHTCARTFCHQ